jgi:hypothetical protein
VIAVKSETSDLKTVERLNSDGTVDRFEGFKQLKKGDRFRVLDEPGEACIWVAICDPFPRPDLANRLAIRAHVEKKAELKIR